MKEKPNPSNASATLRPRAEARLRQRPSRKPSRAGAPKTAADSQRLYHELQVHQVELEMQNAELQGSRDQMEALAEKYTDLYDFAPVGYLSLDPEGRILELNLTGAAMLGVERSRLSNGLLLRFLYPASQPAFVAFLKRVFAGTGRQACEVQLAKRDTEVSWASIRGICALSNHGAERWCRVVMSDITSRKRADEMLRRNEALFSALVEQAPVGMYVVDDQLHLLQVNTRAQPVFNTIRPWQGRKLGEVLRILWPKTVAEGVLARFRQTLKTGERYYSPEFSERRRDLGVREIYEWQLQRVTLPTGGHGVVCFFNNITERKRAEEVRRRLDVLAASNRKLEQEIVRRQAVEQTLRKSEKHQAQLLEQARRMQEQLRHLSRQVLQAQEEERKRISRELHDVIAQTLTGINVRLTALKQEARHNPGSLDRSIARTQKLVEHSVELVHRFARELRPTVLDDLGLIPALHAYLKTFKRETGIQVSLAASAAVDRVRGDGRAVLYRVALEALTNVARHAKASRVDVVIRQVDRVVCLRIRDDGRGFPRGRALSAGKRNRLGLLGMRERLEMVGGELTVTSNPGQGTTIQAQIPIDGARASLSAAPPSRSRTR